MSILKRFMLIIKANVSALFSRMEDPCKMLDVYIEEAEKKLYQVKHDTAQVLAQETKAKRELDACRIEIQKLREYAEHAIKSDNEADAVTFLAEKKAQEERLYELQRVYECALLNSQKMREMHDKLQSEFDSLKAKRASLKTKAMVAKTRMELNGMATGSLDGSSVSAKRIEKVEEKIEEMMDTSEAYEAVAFIEAEGSVACLKDKYHEEVKRASVAAELEEIKKAVGK